MTTLAALTSSTAPGIAYRTVVAIEGYQYLLTDATPAAALTAWAGTDWATDGGALGGLRVQWDTEQRLHPFEPFASNGARVTLYVQDEDGTDTFGVDVFDRESGHFSKLKDDHTPAETTIRVRAADQFDNAPALAYVGPECFYYDAKAATEFQAVTRGFFSPAVNDAGDRFARYHRAEATLDGPDPVSVPATSVRSKPLTWRGRWVYVYIHQLNGSTLDVVADAHLAFAGTIADVTDVQDGRTAVAVDGVIRKIIDHVVLREQWQAKLKPGAWVESGRRFRAGDARTVTGGTVSALEANDLVVVPVGTATPPNQIDEGFYSGDDLATKINDWLAAERVAARLNFKLNLTYADRNEAGESRSSLKMSDPTTTGANIVRTWWLTTTSSIVRNLFGWRDVERIGRDGLINQPTGVAYSSDEPRPFQFYNGGSDETMLTYVHSGRGSFVDQSAFMMPDLATAGVTGFLRIGDGYFPCETPSAGSVTLHQPRLLHWIGAEPVHPAPDEDGEIRVTQVIVLQSSFTHIMLALLSSTGTTDYNWDGFDVLPDHVGAAIPYDLISALEGELDALPAPSNIQNIVIDRPTRLADIVNADFILRGIQFIWRQGKLHLKGMATPTSSATLTITDADKFRHPSENDPLNVVSQESDEWLRNTIVIKHNGTPILGEYRDTTTVTDAPSAAAHGSRVLTITARNDRPGPFTIGSMVVEQLPRFASMMSLLSRPMMRVAVRVGYPLFETHTPGETVLLSDSFVRDAATGARTISGKPAIIIASSFDWNEGLGEISLAMFPGLSIAPWSPSARIDETASAGGFSAGYNNGTTTIRCKANYHSPAGAAVDASRFAINDAITIVEIDPPTAASPLSWDRTIAAISGSDIQVSSALGGWDNTKLYRVISQSYTSAATTQKADTYQADDDDGKVQDARAPYALALFGAGQTASFSSVAATALPARPPDLAFGDGKPLDVGHAYDLATSLNNLVSYKTASQVPEHVEEMTYGGAGTWRLVYCRLVFLGVGRPSVVRSRKLYVSPTIKKSGAASSDIRVTLARHRPRSADEANASRDDVVRVAPYSSTTFTTTAINYENQTAVALDTEHLNLGAEGGGFGWLYVEVKTAGYFRGMGACYVGPVVAP